MNVLINKFIGREIINGDNSRTELEKMAEELKRREPGNPSVYKLAVSIEELGGKGDIYRGAEEAEKGLRISPNDSELQDSWFYFKSKDPNFHLDEFLDQNPNPFGEYYLIGSSWNQNNTAQVIEELKSLIARYPDNSSFRDTLDALQKGNAREDSFSPRFDISKDNW